MEYKVRKQSQLDSVKLLIKHVLWKKMTHKGLSGKTTLKGLFSIHRRKSDDQKGTPKTSSEIII